jgi:hypothetical protein
MALIQRSSGMQFLGLLTFSIPTLPALADMSYQFHNQESAMIKFQYLGIASLIVNNHWVKLNSPYSKYQNLANIRKVTWELIFSQFLMVPSQMLKSKKKVNK